MGAPLVRKPRIRHRYRLADRIEGRVVFCAGTSGGVGILWKPMYPLGLMSVLRKKSSGFWAKAAMDTSTRITTAVTEVDLMTRASLGVENRV